jgi:hypothetical protein
VTTVEIAAALRALPRQMRGMTIAEAIAHYEGKASAGRGRVVRSEIVVAGRRVIVQRPRAAFAL